MAERPKVDYEATEDLLLFRLHFALTRNEDLDTSIDELSRLLKLTLPLVKVCAAQLDGNGYCQFEKRTGWRGSGYRYADYV